MLNHDTRARFGADLKQWIDLLSNRCKRLEESNETYRRHFDSDSFRWIEEDIDAVETTKEIIKMAVPAIIARYGIDKENLTLYKGWIEKQIHLAARKAKEEKEKIEETGFYGKYSEARGKLDAYNHVNNIIADELKNFS